MRKGPSKGTKKKNVRKEIIITLAQQGPLGKYQIKQKTGLNYPSIHKAIDSFVVEGSVGIVDTVLSEKNVKINIYALTFKGTLKYLSRSYRESHKEFEQPEEKLIQFIERQGVLLNYPLFQEFRWLYDHDKNVIRFFVSVAKDLLGKPLADDAALAEELKLHISLNKRVSKNHFTPAPHDPNDPKELLLGIRYGENQNLMFDFAEYFLVYGMGQITVKAATEANPRLSAYAKEILEDNLWKIQFLDRAVKIFSE